jgi:hypothetical protein
VRRAAPEMSADTPDIDAVWTSAADGPAAGTRPARGRVLRRPRAQRGRHNRAVAHRARRPERGSFVRVGPADACRSRHRSPSSATTRPGRSPCWTHPPRQQNRLLGRRAGPHRGGWVQRTNSSPPPHATPAPEQDDSPSPIIPALNRQRTRDARETESPAPLLRRSPPGHAESWFRWLRLRGTQRSSVGRENS